MGNVCIGSKRDRKGFLASVTGVVWKFRYHEKGPDHKKEHGTGTSPSKNDNSTDKRASRNPQDKCAAINSSDVQSTPPAPVKIASNETKQEELHKHVAPSGHTDNKTNNAPVDNVSNNAHTDKITNIASKKKRT